jgi:hypothetical protein
MLKLVLGGAVLPHFGRVAILSFTERTNGKADTVVEATAAAEVEATEATKQRKATCARTAGAYRQGSCPDWPAA